MTAVYALQVVVRRADQVKLARLIQSGRRFAKYLDRKNLAPESRIEIQESAKYYLYQTETGRKWQADVVGFAFLGLAHRNLEEAIQLVKMLALNCFGRDQIIETSARLLEVPFELLSRVELAQREGGRTMAQIVAALTDGTFFYEPINHWTWNLTNGKVVL